MFVKKRWNLRQIQLFALKHWISLCLPGLVCCLDWFVCLFRHSLWSQRESKTHAFKSLWSVLRENLSACVLCVRPANVTVQTDRLDTQTEDFIFLRMCKQIGLDHGPLNRGLRGPGLGQGLERAVDSTEIGLTDWNEITCDAWVELPDLCGACVELGCPCCCYHVRSGWYCSVLSSLMLYVCIPFDSPSFTSYLLLRVTTPLRPWNFTVFLSIFSNQLLLRPWNFTDKTRHTVKLERRCLDRIHTYILISLQNIYRIQNACTMYIQNIYSLQNIYRIQNTCTIVQCTYIMYTLYNLHTTQHLLLSISYYWPFLRIIFPVTPRQSNIQVWIGQEVSGVSQTVCVVCTGV